MISVWLGLNNSDFCLGFCYNPLNIKEIKLGNMGKYQPSKEVLNKYADALVNFALGGGEGIEGGDTVFIRVSESAKPILHPLMSAVLRSGGNPAIKYSPDEEDRKTSVGRIFYELANEDQLTYSPRNYLLGGVEDADHSLAIISTNDKHRLEGIDTSLIMKRSESLKYYKEARIEKENRGEYTWTLGLYGTEAMAEEVGMSLSEYWDQIIKACYLDREDPIQRWKEIMEEIDQIKNRLNSLDIDMLHIEGEGVDLRVKIGPHREWLGGSGRNIPSFEIFISPDWRGTEGWVKFNQPLYRYGNLVKGIEIEFEGGEVKNIGAEQNEELLKEMVKVEGANRIGEFSLTDKRHSRITEFMAETLYDENAGGDYGNFHIALGMAYKDSYDGDISEMDEWEEMGFNDSVIHTDIVSTTDRKVTATLEDGSEKVIYKDGRFQV